MKISNEVIFSILRTLKKVNPGDTYYENYMWHLNKRKETFYDIYHFSWEWVIKNHPRRILEIGTRTGISLAQLLSAYIDHSIINKIVCCDIFSDGFTNPGIVKLYLNYLGIPNKVIDNIEFLIGDSKKKIPEYKLSHSDAKFDYILVDGSHDKEDALQDLRNVHSLVSNGGVIVFDDIGVDGMNLKDIWCKFKYSLGNEFECNEDYNGKGVGWAIKKK